MEDLGQPVSRRMAFGGVRSLFSHSVRSVLDLVDLGLDHRLDLVSALDAIPSGTGTARWVMALDTAEDSDTAAILVITAARQVWDTAAEPTAADRT